MKGKEISDARRERKSRRAGEERKTNLAENSARPERDFLRAAVRWNSQTSAIRLRRRR